MLYAHFLLLFQLVVVFIISGFAGIVIADNGEVPDESPSVNRSVPDEVLAKFILDGMWAARDRVRSGRVEVQVTKRFLGESGKEREGNNIVVVDKYQVSFDHDASKLRCDHRGQSGSGRGESVRLTHYSETPDGTILHVDGSNTVIKEPPGTKVIIQDARPVEVRLVGMATLNEFTLPATIEQYREYLAKLKLSGVKEVQKGIYRLSLNVTGTKPPITFSLWVDTKKGFAPVRTKVTQSNNNTEHVLSDVRTEWSNESDVWVPIVSTITEPPPEMDGTIKLEWLAVNEPIPDKEFIEDDFRLSDGTTIWNKRLGQSVLERVIGKEKKSFDTTEPAGQSSLVLRTLLVVISGVLLLVLLSIWIWRHRQMKSAK